MTDTNYYTMSNNLKIDEYTDSTLISNGALVVEGGAGIKKNLNVGEKICVDQLDAYNPVTLQIGTNNAAKVEIGNTGVQTDIKGGMDVTGNITLTGTVDGRDISADAAHFTDTNNPHSVTKTQVGLSNVQNIKMNFSATTDPTATDDNSQGYDIGSQWINVNGGKSFICTSNTIFLAIWKETTVGDEVNTVSNIGTAGVGLYKDSIGNDLRFKKINAGSDKVTVTDDTDNDEVDIDIVPGNISHLQLAHIGTNSHAQIDAHISNVTNPHSVTKEQLGLGNLTNIKSNLNAIIAPTVDDDTNSGYSIGSRWVDTVEKKEYSCVDASSGTAVWIETTNVGLTSVDYVEDDTLVRTTSSVYKQMVRLTINIDETLDYLIQWYTEVMCTYNTTHARVKVELDDTTILGEVSPNPDTSKGTGWGSVSGFKKVNLSAGSHNIDLDFASCLGGKEVRTRNCRLLAMRCQ